MLLGSLAVTNFPRVPTYQGKTIRAWALQLSAPEPAARAEATAAITALGTNAIPELLKLLQTHDPRWRRTALSLAAKLPTRWGQKVVNQLGPSRAAALQVGAAQALGVLGPKAAVAAPQLALAMSEPGPGVRGAAVTALEQIGEPAIPDLTLVLLQAKDPVVRRTATFLLGRLGAQAAIPGLALALDDVDPGVRVEAVSTLLRMGAQSWPAVPALVAHLNDPDATVRAFASSSLSMIGNPTLPAVSKVLASGDTNAQKAVLKFLAQNYRSLRLTGAPLRKLAQEGTPALRQQTIETLSLLRLDDDATVKILAAALKDPAPEVRLAAIKAFACLPSKADAAIPALRSCLEDESSAVRAAAKELLQRVPEAAPGSAVSPAE